MGKRLEVSSTKSEVSNSQFEIRNVLCTKNEKYGYLECEKTAKSKGETFMTSPSKSQIKKLLDRLEDLRGHL